MKTTCKQAASLFTGLILAVLLLTVSAFAAEPSVQAAYGNGTVTVSAQGLWADTVYHLISIQKSDSVVALKSGSTNGSGAMSVQIPTGTLENGTYQVYIFKNEDGSVAASGSFTVQSSNSSSGSGSSSSGSSDKSYMISIPSTKNGDVSVTPKNASKGDTVTVTVSPDSGYELGTISVKDASGNTVKLTDKGKGTYTFTMPGSKVTISAEFVEAQAGSTFADVPSSTYYAKAVEWAVKNGITNGKVNGLFGSNDPCTRGQIVTFLWRAAGSPAPKGTAKVPYDVLPISYCYNAVAWALENGITNGFADGSFSGNQPCTRGQAVTFLYRAMRSVPAAASSFTDVAADSYFANAVAWAVENGVTNGTTNSTFSPNNSCTRAQIITFLYRASN